MEKKLNDIKRYLRDIKFSIIFGEGQITLENDLKEFDNKVPFLFGKSHQKKRNMYIKQMKELDGVLTGSAALSMYRINGVRIFKRYPNDLDFMVSRDNFMKFCGMNDFTNVKYTNQVVSLDFYTGKDRGSDSYGYHRGYYFHTDFDVIGTDEEVDYEMVGDLKVAKLMDIINYKLYLIEKYMKDISNRDAESEAKKHIGDLFMIVTTISANESKTTKR
jgi:hypothetical protein